MDHRSHCHVRLGFLNLGEDRLVWIAGHSFAGVEPGWASSCQAEMTIQGQDHSERFRTALGEELEAGSRHVGSECLVGACAAAYVKVEIRAEGREGQDVQPLESTLDPSC